MTISFDWSGSRSPLFFPVTPFDADGRVNVAMLQTHIAERMEWGPAGVFVACGTGEFSALDVDEYEQAVNAAVEVVAGRVPVIAGTGYGAALAFRYLDRAERAGADGALVMPPTTGVPDQRGLIGHYAGLAHATSLPLIVYQRDQTQLTPETACELAAVDGIVGLKDGLGGVENLVRIVSSVGERWSYFNGMPTAELSVPAFRGIGISHYSSAVFAFLPEVASAYFLSVRDGDDARRDALLRSFYLPFAAIRDRRPGYAVSLIKAGLNHRGVDVGPVRAPLPDPGVEDARELGRLIESTIAAEIWAEH
jgi:5-dehydro-4-deoxyglucarate dehydratase